MIRQTGRIASAPRGKRFAFLTPDTGPPTPRAFLHANDYLGDWPPPIGARVEYVPAGGYQGMRALNCKPAPRVDDARGDLKVPDPHRRNRLAGSFGSLRVWPFWSRLRAKSAALLRVTVAQCDPRLPWACHDRR